MKIVIELPDETYKDIKEENSIYGINNGLSARITGKVVGAIQSGTPLPKGHGRLIDINALTFLVKGDDTLLVDAPTIIEADKEED